ncbi:MAG: DoxX family protein [Candidatus Omnitrophota bacterium]
MAQKLLNKYTDEGLLFIRVGLGIMFIIHGFPKMVAGPDQWAVLGKAMANLGIGFAPVFWGFMAAFAELVGGAVFLGGLFFRTACLLLAFDMFVASVFHFKHGDGLMVASHAIELGIVFFGLIFIGSGKYSLGCMYKKKK